MRGKGEDFQTAQYGRQIALIILENLQSGAPAHTAFFINDRESEQKLQDILNGATAAGPKGYQTERGLIFSADTLEILADLQV